MSVTVQHILELPILKRANVLSGSTKLSEQPVEWMTATEGTAKDFVRKDEIILTTGVGYPSAEELLGFVKDVYQAQAAALAIATGKYIEKIPAEVIEFAEGHDFIMIELPWDVRFTDIQRQTTKAINQMQHGYIEEAQQMQDRLYDYVVQGKELDDIINYVENELGCSIVFTDHYGRVKSALVAEPHLLIQAWDEASQGRYTLTYQEEGLTLENTPYKQGFLLKKDVATNPEPLCEGYYIF